MAPSLFFLNSDDRLLDMMKKGDEEALVMLYKANKRMVSSYLLRNSGNENDAQDMLQEAVIVLWERVRSGRFEHSAKLSTFIYATVQNMWRRRLIKMKREIPSDVNDDVLNSYVQSTLDDLIEEEQSRNIAAALVKMGEPCRTLLILFYWEEKSMEQIAKELKFANADTVKSKKYQCKKALESILRDEHII